MREPTRGGEPPAQDTECHLALQQLARFRATAAEACEVGAHPGAQPTRDRLFTSGDGSTFRKDPQRRFDRQVFFRTPAVARYGPLPRLQRAECFNGAVRATGYRDSPF